MAEPYVYSKFALKAVVTTKSGDVTFEDIVSISATFGLNSIPTATMVVAVGYDARSNQTKKATIHDAKAKFRPRDKVIVTLTITPEEGNREKMESGEFVIFEGMLAGTGYQRSSNSANYTMHLVHWLDELNNSSMLNGNWFPNAPYDLAFNAGCYAAAAQASDAGIGQPSDALPVPAFDPDGQIINHENASTDLWGAVIKPVFESVANFDLPNDGKNTAALDALSRIPGGAQGSAPLLGLNLDGLASHNMDEALRKALEVDALESFAYTSFWGKLIGHYAPQFFFAISPGVEHALAIPFFGGLRWKAGQGKEIAADEYSYANFNAHMTQLLETVTVFWPFNAAVGPELGLEINNVDSFAQPLGFYPISATGNENEDRPGLKLFKEPPTWIANIASWGGAAGATTGVKAQTPGDCMAPGTGDSNPSPDWFTQAEAAQAMTDSAVANRFAHHWYKTELLGQRYGELSGKLRFDIAPGSIVRIEMPIAEIGSDGYMVAAVTQVSYSINAERALAGTSFALAYIRTIEEDGDENISAASAPLYNDGIAWFGGALKTSAG